MTDDDNVSSGSSTTVSGGATLTVGPGESVSGVYVDGGTIVVSGGYAIDTNVAASPGTSDDTTAFFVGTMTVESGTVVSTVISAASAQYERGYAVSAVQTLGAGAIASATILSGYLGDNFDTGGDHAVTAAASQTIGSGALATDTILNGGAVSEVENGGTSIGETLSGSSILLYNTSYGLTGQQPYSTYVLPGEQAVDSGGIVSGAQILQYGELDVASGASVSDVDLDDGTLLLSSGAQLQDALTLHSGTIEFADFAYGSGSVFSLDDDVLTVTGPDGTRSVRLAQNYFGDPTYFGAAPDGRGTDVDFGPMCYGHGTLILTPQGERLIETLATGDLVLTHAGIARPVRWIGRRAYDPVFARGNADIMPVRVRQGALGRDARDRPLPHRDLVLSPLHALYLDGVLVPVLHLIDGRGIARLETGDAIRYLQVELDTHDLLVAEGVPAESFLDEGDRLGFHNAQEYAALYPDAVRPPPVYCAPRIEDGPLLEAIRARLAGQAPLIAAIETCDGRQISGWAFAPGQDGPAIVEIRLGARVLGACVASLPRPDVSARTDGAPSEMIGFCLGLPRGTAAFDPADLDVVRVARRLAA